MTNVNEKAVPSATTTWEIKLSTSFSCQFLLYLLSYFTFFSSGMATNSNDTSSVPQKAADAVFVPTQEHGFNNKVQGKMIPDLEMSLHTFRCVLFTVF